MSFLWRYLLGLNLNEFKSSSNFRIHIYVPKLSESQRRPVQLFPNISAYQLSELNEERHYHMIENIK